MLVSIDIKFNFYSIFIIIINSSVYKGVQKKL